MRLSAPSRLAFLAAIAVCAFFGANVSAARATDYNATVVIDGRHIALNPPAILRDGSVFVPVRGVFENMGASVVYNSGHITAHGARGETITMDVGQRQATVNGQLVMLDTAPFIMGSTTYVPLRFVSEALGATVSFDNRTKTVFIVTAQSSPAPTPGQTAPPSGENVRLVNEQPRRGSTVQSATPAIAANFSESVDPGSVIISVDGRSVTSQALIGPNSFSVTPPFELRSGTRGVSVSGKSSGGLRFEQSWSFNVVPNVSLTRNYVQIRSPGSGATVTASSFQVAGRTLPLAVVTVSASSAASYPSYPGLVGPGPGFTQQVRADPLGNFSTNVSMPNAGGYVRVFVQSVAPDGSSAEASVTVPSQ